MNGSNIIVLILVIITAMAIYSVATDESFCNCAGLGWKTAKPTYYVYRPTGDVSNYGESNYGDSQPQPVIYPQQNLGWRTGMPYDYFADHMKGANWAAGADPNPAVNSSVPLLATQDMTVMSNGGYLKNYGSPPCTVTTTPNMLSDGSPQYEGPAGSFSDTGYSCPFAKTCPSANAYNLGVGVL